MKLPEFSVNRSVTAVMLVAIVAVVGIICFTQMGLDFFPDLEFPTVSVVTTYPGASSEDIETVLTRPLEQVVSSVNRVKKVTSTTSEGVSVISLEFEWGTNLDFAAQDVRDLLSQYDQFLPEEANTPLVMKFSFSQFPVVFWGVTSDLPPLRLKTLLEDDVAPRLERIDGVASARVFAMDTREILVDVDKAALESRGLAIDRVVMALRGENLNLPAGNLVERHSDYLVRTLGEFETLDDMRRTVVGTTATGEPIYLSDIGEVRDTLRETRYVSRIQRQNGVYVMVNKRSGANTQQVGARVKKELAKIVPSLPGKPAFHMAMDQSRMIEMVTSQTVENAWQGGLLAILFIFLFLRNWRPTLIIGITIPLSIIATFIALKLAGYTLNLLTLGGLALGIGMLVDNAIVIIENIFRHLEEGKTSREAAIVGTSEVGMAITASTLTSIAVFFPMVFAKGITGKLTQALGVTVAAAQILSLLVALAVVPLLASFLFRARKSYKDVARAPEERQFAKARAVYQRWLEAALRNRGKVLAGTIGAFVVAMGVLPFLGAEFMPSQDQNMLLLKVRMPVGTAIAETDRVVAMVEDVLAKHSEVTMISSQIGSQASQDAGDAASGMSNAGTHEGLLWVGLVEVEQRSRSDKQIMESIRGLLPKLKDVKFEALDMSSQMMGASSGLEIKIFGRDLPVLRQLADTAAQRVRDVPGLRDVTHTLAKGKPEVRIRIDREKAYRLGLSVYQVANGVQAATLGRVATRFREGNEETDIRLRFQERYRNTLEEIRSLPLLTPAGQSVYLEQVASIERGEGPISITRENQARRVSLTANIVGRDLGSTVRDVKSRLAGFQKSLPSGYFLEYGGAYEQMTEAFLILAGAFALAVLLVYMVMASQFEHLVHPLVIMFTVPLALIGVVFGMFVTGRPLSLPIIIGVILLVGIAVNNGIVMIDYINQLIRSGMDRRQAVVQGSVTRLRAVLMTALTSILGTLPMAFSRSSGSEFRAPLAVATGFGLAATTVLTLFVIPIIYSLFNRIAFAEKKAKKGRRPEPVRAEA